MFILTDSVIKCKTVRNIIIKAQRLFNMLSSFPLFMCIYSHFRISVYKIILYHMYIKKKSYNIIISHVNILKSYCIFMLVDVIIKQ